MPADVLSAEARMLMSPDDLPVEGTYKDDFWEMNAELKVVPEFEALRKTLTKDFDGDTASRVMWFLVYLNYSSLVHDGQIYNKKFETLRDALNLPKPVLELKVVEEANSVYRMLTLPRPFRVLQAVGRQIDDAIYFLEKNRISSIKDVNSVTALMKDFNQLKALHDEAMASYQEQDKQGVLRERNGRILSAYQSRSLFQD